MQINAIKPGAETAKTASLRLAGWEKAYPMRFTAGAFEKIAARLPQDKQEYKEILTLLNSPVTACEVAADLIEGASDGEPIPTVKDIKKADMREAQTIREMCLLAILQGLGIETHADDEDVDETLRSKEKNVKTGA